jgi:hypothetical protein
VCVLLGDGGLLLCSGGVFFLVSSRSVIFFGVRSEVVFSLGPFRGGIFFGVRSEGKYKYLRMI